MYHNVTLLQYQAHQDIDIQDSLYTILFHKTDARQHYCTFLLEIPADIVTLSAVELLFEVVTVCMFDKPLLDIVAVSSWDATLLDAEAAFSFQLLPLSKQTKVFQCFKCQYLLP